MLPNLVITSVTPHNAESVGRLFETLHGDPHFHPHPFTQKEAKKIARRPTGKDVYITALLKKPHVKYAPDAVAYGMLRGWDEGYAIPRLGVAVHPEHRGRGFARMMVEVLHTWARLREAEFIELKVYSTNTHAKTLYESLGYVWADEEEGQLLGVKDLRRKTLATQASDTAPKEQHEV